MADTTVPILITPAGSSWSQWSVGNTEETGYLFDIKVRVNTTSASKGRARLRLLRNGAVEQMYEQYLDGVSGIEQDIELLWVGKTDASDVWTVQVSSNVALRVVDTDVTAARFGGGLGPRGPQGIQGYHAYMGAAVADVASLPSVGNPGEMRYVSATGALWAWDSNADNPGWVNAGTIRGPAGSANTGFSQFDDVAGRDTTAAPPAGGTVPLTADQGIPYPTGVHSPHVPYFIKLLVDKLERLVVSRYPSSTALNAARPTRDNGEVFWLDSGDTTMGRLFVQDSRSPSYGLGVVPFVMHGTTAPAASTTLPDGSLFLVY